MKFAPLHAEQNNDSDDINNSFWVKNEVTIVVF